MALSEFLPKFIDDPYDRTARLYPSLLVLAPLAVLVVCLYGRSNTAASTVLSILGVSGGAYALGRIARDAGKRKQDRLFEKWGGAPTTQLLRHRDRRIDVHSKERFHLLLSKGMKKPFPGPASEQRDPDAADELYRAAAIWLIGQTRNTKSFPLVFRENIAFGFHRNALGLRPLGLIVALGCIGWILFHERVFELAAPYFSITGFVNLGSGPILALCVSVVLLVAWIFLFTEAALKRTAFSYAERLIQSCDLLTSSSPSASKPKAAAKTKEASPR